MVTTGAKTATIGHLEQLCRVVSAVSQGQVFVAPPPAGSQTSPRTEAREGVLTSAIVEGRLAGWLFSRGEEVSSRGW